MVGFDPKSDRELSPLNHSLAGAFSGFTTRFLLQPLDVLKIRFQLQVEPIERGSLRSKYRGLFHAAGCILKEERLPALWKGHVPAQILSILYGIIQFSAFEFYTKQLWVRFPLWQHAESPSHTVCGSLAGCSATLVSHPFDVLRTRLVAQGEPKVYSGLGQAMVQMLQDEGPRSFFKGLVPNMIQIAPYVGAQFGFFRLLTQIWERPGMTDQRGVSKELVCGGLAGAAAKGLCYPLDVVKKRLQVQGFESARRPFGEVRTYSGPLHCLRTVFAEEGLRGIYKGLYPSLIKASLATGCHFAVYEFACKSLHSWRRDL